jgi:hypothetical protein
MCRILGDVKVQHQEEKRGKKQQRSLQNARGYPNEKTCDRDSEEDDESLRLPGMYAQEPEDASVEQVRSGHHVREVVAKRNLAMKYPNPMLEVKGLIERHDERGSSERESPEIKERQCGRGEQEKTALSNIADRPGGRLGFHFTLRS